MNRIRRRSSKVFYRMFANQVLGHSLSIANTATLAPLAYRSKAKHTKRRYRALPLLLHFTGPLLLSRRQLFFFQGVRAIVEWVRHGNDTTVFVSSVVLCVAWAAASVLRSRDHWREAAKEPKVIGDDGTVARRKTWWALWPFFNLSFITAVLALVDHVRNDGKSYSGFTDVVADDRLWNVAALATTLMFMTYSVMRGAEVTLCARKPNAEFTAGFLSAALFSWFTPVIDVGQTKQLDLDDLPVQVRKEQHGRT